MFRYVLVLGLVFAPRFLAITNGDATAAPGKGPHADPLVLTPEELLHGVVPCTCIDIRLCPGLLNSLKHPISASSTELKHLQRFTCGFKGFTPFVCCNEIASTPMVDASPHPPTRPFYEATSPHQTGYDVLRPIPDLFSSTFNPTEQGIASVANPYDKDSKTKPRCNISTSGGDTTGYYPTESVTEIFSGPISSSTSLHSVISSTQAASYSPTEATLGGGFARDTNPPTYTIPKKHPGNGNIPTTPIPVSSKTPPRSQEKDLHNSKTNSTTPAIYVKVPFTPGPPTDANNAANEKRFKENPYESYETTATPYLHVDSSPITSASSPVSVYVTSSSDHSYDPTKDIADVFWNSSQHIPKTKTSTPKTHTPSYDPTNDIRDLFGAGPNKGSQQPDRKPNTQTEPNFPLVTKKLLDKAQTGVSSSQVTVTPGYDKVSKLPEITVTYNVLVKNTNIERKYIDFFNMFYKNNLNKPSLAQGTPNSLGSELDKTFQVSPLKGIQLNSLGSSGKDIRDGKQVPSDSEYFNYQTIQKPRSTSTHRYVRQYNPDFYFDNRFAPHYFTRHLSSSPNYYPQPSNRPQYTNNRRTNIYGDVHKTQTQSPDSWLYDDYNTASDSESVPTSVVQAEPLSAYQQYNNYPHHMRNRGTEFNRNFGRTRPRTRKPGPPNDGSITFPNEDDNERKPFGQYTPNLDSSYFPGPFFNDNPHRRPYPNNPRPPSRKPSPYNPNSPWGYNHPNHYPGYNEDVPEPDPVNNQPFTDPPKQPNKTPMLANSVSTAAPPAPTTVPVTPVTAATTAPPTPAPSTQTVPPVVSPAPTEAATPPPPAASDLVVKRQLLPGDECGVSVDERIVGGKTATLGAYPWIARIGYLRPGSDRVLYRCAGTLINSRYVITAAHCVTNLPGGLVLSTIRLGELDDTTDPDCVNDECADPVQNYSPTQITVHQTYDKPQFKNDVGLVRLDRPVNVTTYVSPICLPFDSLRSKNYTGLKAVVAGWGASNVGTSSATPVLQWVSLTVAPLAQCVRTFATRTGVQVGPGQMCAGGEQGRDSCEGDSGGPLMRPEQPDADSLPRYFLIGIVSFGAKRCGSDNMPGVYTDVASYLDWILTSIQP